MKFTLNWLSCKKYIDRINKFEKAKAKAKKNMSGELISL